MSNTVQANRRGVLRPERCPRRVRLALISGHALGVTVRPFRADSVAKVFLRHGSQILRGVGAAIEQRCGGPRRHTPNSQAILAAGLRLYRAAIVACFVLWREFSKLRLLGFLQHYLPTTDRTALLVSVSVERVSVCCLLLLGVGESRFEHFANRLPRAAVELN
jgi:hypothetical protein